MARSSISTPLALILALAVGGILGTGVYVVKRWLAQTADVAADGKRANPAKGDGAAPAGFAPTLANKAEPKGPAPEGMVWIPGGEFSMGCEDPRLCVDGGRDPMVDTRPIHRAYVDGFWMDKTVVTNEQFAKFVAATGYVTIAEQTPKAEDFPGAPP
jgi:sulfatase modifying factor 1